MREAFAEALKNAAIKDRKLILLTGDHGYALFDPIRKACTDQFLNAGVAEQNMIGVAAGLAKGGFLPVIYGLSAFVPIRVLEQIKLDLCYENLPAILVGDGAGVVYSALGTSHQSTEDLAALRAVPNLTILSPADRFEMQEAFEIALHLNSTVYLRMGKADLGDCHTTRPRFKKGELVNVKTGTSGVAFIATGSMVHLSLKLTKEAYPDCAVYSAPFIKPLSNDAVRGVLKKYSAVVVLEEHSTYGGLGGAIAEIAAETAETRVLRIGVNDRFSEFCGTYDYLMVEHGLDLVSVDRKIKSWDLDFAPVQS